MQTVTVTIPEEHAGMRLDKSLVLHMPDFSRSRVQQLLEEGHVRLRDATITDAGRKVKSGESFAVSIPEIRESGLVASAIALDVVYEDKDLLIINKPAGMAVHPAPGHVDDTLVNALLTYCGESLSGIGGVMRPGIVHRIDKDTSGLLVVAKHDVAHRHLSAQLADRSLTREYLCVVKGMPLPSGTIDAPIARSPVNRKKMAVVKGGGRHAVTHYTMVERLNRASLVRCKLETGRTHQIRVHLSHLGFPLIGDPVYGRKAKDIDFPRQALHAARLKLIHPASGEAMEFNAPLPPDMQALLAALRTETT